MEKELENQVKSVEKRSKLLERTEAHCAERFGRRGYKRNLTRCTDRTLLLEG